MQIELTPFQESHVELMHKWASDPKLEEYFRRHPPLFTWNTLTLTMGTFSQGYVINVDSTPVGYLSLSNYDPQNKRVELGLLLDAEYKEKRAAVFVEACRQAAGMVFKHLGYNKLYAYILPHRTGLQRIMASYGFKREGYLRDHTYWKGEFHDEELWSILREDL
jgi:ribosomal-protein-alanine N-acetyltransferase